MQQSSGSDRALRTLAFLRRKITSGEWPINSKIPIETELMQLLGVGKTTVREAVRSLASIGMLETLPGRGTFVRSRTPVSSVLTDYLSDYDSSEILVYRRALEIEAARQAALHRTDDQLEAMRAARPPADGRTVGHPVIERGRTPGQFHTLLFEASESRLLQGLHAGVMASLRRAINRGTVVVATDEEVRRHDHAEILAAIEERDAARAAHAMAVHVDRDLTPAPAAPEPGDRESDTTPRAHPPSSAMSPSATPPRQHA